MQDPRPLAHLSSRVAARARGVTRLHPDALTCRVTRGYTELSRIAAGECAAGGEAAPP